VATIGRQSGSAHRTCLTRIASSLRFPRKDDHVNLHI
jgi:hypothetical protein